MSLLTLRDAHIAFGERPLLDGAQLTVLAGERLGLIGRNGTGKSTLLAVIAGRTPLDEGELQRRDGLRLALVEQEPELPAAESLRQSLLLLARGPFASGSAPSAALAPAVSPADEREHWRMESRLEEFLDREMQRYAAQLRKYMELARGLGPNPVRAALYFPLLGAFRELT